jgi:hypothetical protein
MIYYFHFLATWGWFRRPILPTLMYSISCINLLRIGRVPIILQASFKLTTPAFPESQMFSCSPPVPPSLYPHALFGASPTQESLHLEVPAKAITDFFEPGSSPFWARAKSWRRLNEQFCSIKYKPPASPSCYTTTNTSQRQSGSETSWAIQCLQSCIFLWRHGQ